VILSKGKTDKEIRKRKLEREEEEADNKSAKLKTESKETQLQLAKEERVCICLTLIKNQNFGDSNIIHSHQIAYHCKFLGFNVLNSPII
jgi:hypothetical protein